MRFSLLKIMSLMLLGLVSLSGNAQANLEMSAAAEKEIVASIPVSVEKTDEAVKEVTVASLPSKEEIKAPAPTEEETPAPVPVPAEEAPALNIPAEETFALAPAEEAFDDDVIILSMEEGRLTDSEMAISSGASGVTTMDSSQSLVAVGSDNTLYVGGDLTNGNIYVGDTLGGLGSYVMNTGNNSTINSAVSLNLQIVPSP